ncbi:YeeF [Streptococcus sp. DD11]|uniref:YwqJ-related putative deaminase n=1 Tax=Streptococcus sp. DD11 TaxID=1777879 RepID=UPI00079989B6|nr:YwqJ-related putative deaminase [Streptococcus sp. DD11]KXT83685.1 YeeF [Streptococcus sp. DD11]
MDVDLPGGSGRVPKVDTSNLNLRSQAAPDITVGRGAADIDAPSISGAKAVPDLPSAKQVAAESAAGVVGGARVKDVDVPRVKDVATPSRTGDVGVPKMDSQSSTKMSEPSRLEYLRNKYGTISAEELNQRINLRGETMKQYNAMKEVVKSKRQLGPAFATVYDKTTGKYYSAINNFDGKKPGDLHPLLQERFNNASQNLIDSYVKTKGFASHAEVYAVNEALKANPNATMDDLLVNVIHTDKGKSYINKMPYAGGEMFVRCPHCQYMLDGFNMISEVGK